MIAIEASSTLESGLAWLYALAGIPFVVGGIGVILKELAELLDKGVSRKE